MKPAQIDLTIEQGARFDKVLYYKPNNVAADLTGYTARMQVRQTVASNAVLLELTTENGRITITADEGKLTLFVASADTAALTFTDAVYDLELVDGDGEVIRLCRGAVHLEKEVTRGV
jgi:hypothetical protein